MPSSTEIPLIDVSGVLAGDEEAVRRAAAELRHAYQDVGFWFLAGHDVPQSLIDETFAAAERFHAMPMERKMALKANRNNVGYLPLRGTTTRHAALTSTRRPNQLEAFMMKRDLPDDHPDVVAGKLFRGRNQWPTEEELPGFRASCLAYSAALERLALSVLPIYAVALGLPGGWFGHAFHEPSFTLRLSHYPPQEPTPEVEEYGIAPHADTTFMTLLAPNTVGGLSLRTRSGTWIDAPVIPGAFLVNSGELLRRWTNDRFMATPHRVINRTGVERYALPFFFDTTYDYRMECLPTCRSADNPPKYPPVSYQEYQIEFQRLNYDHVRERDGIAPETA
jgi:isopenicillin N synthase-like dioxygenase